MPVDYEMTYDDARVLHYSTLLIIDRQSSRDDIEKLAAISKHCFAFTISYDDKQSRNLTVTIEPRLLKEICNGIRDLSLNVEGAAQFHLNVNGTIPGTPYLLRNLADLLPAMRANVRRIEQLLAESQVV